MKFRIAETNDLEILNEVSVKSKAYWGYPEAWIAKWKDELTLTKEEFSEQHILVVKTK